jgi:hypothetical protein
MAATLGSYRSSVTTFATAGTGWQLMLGPDPRRWYLRIVLRSAVAVTLWVGPDGTQGIGVPTVASTFPVESKFPDRPAGTSGAWWVFSAGVVTIVLEQDLYVGG